MWNCINNEYDIKCFLNRVYNFHDSCIKEMKYLSGAFVDNKLKMYPINDKRILRVIIQCQIRNNPVVEMKFVGLRFLKLFPNDDQYTSEMLDTTLKIKNNRIYWCDQGGLLDANFDDYDGTLICADQLYWRILDSGLGSGELYSVNI